MLKSKYCGIIAGFNTETIKAVIERLTIRAFADEGEAGGESSNEGGEPEKKAPTINYEDLIAKARREEKDKQYKNIERLKGQIDTLTKQHNDDLIEKAYLEKQLQAANEKLTKAGSGDSEEIKALKETIETLKSEKSALDKKVKEYEDNKPQSREEIEKEVRAELEKEYEVKTYKAEKLAELKDKILVPEFVVGDSKEDIDKSIEAAIARSDEIRKSLGITEDSKKKQKRTPNTPSNPSSDNTGGREISYEYLASLDVGSPEYAQVRKQLGLK